MRKQARQICCQTSIGAAYTLVCIMPTVAADDSGLLIGETFPASVPLGEQVRELFLVALG